MIKKWWSFGVFSYFAKKWTFAHKCPISIKFSENDINVHFWIYMATDWQILIFFEKFQPQIKIFLILKLGETMYLLAVSSLFLHY